MICPNCQGNISDKRERCDYCKADLALYKKISAASKKYYNDGLAKARVRDLSGAAIALKKSLEFDKANTDARNLLGLVYFEMGETVNALSEWVISRHFMPDDNDAENYINAVQENPTKLDTLNQAIKRYNNALNYAKQGSDDLAIIQLKKVTSLNSHFIRAYHLLALLYIKNGEKDKARRCLLRVNRIDVSNTLTLHYLKEVEPQSSQGLEESNTVPEGGYNTPIMPVSSYKEDKPNIVAYVNLVIGVLIGLAVMAFLVIPSIKRNQTDDNNKAHVDYSAGLAALEAKDKVIEALQKDKQDLEQQTEQLKEELDSIVIPETNPALYDPLFQIFQDYLDEQSKPSRDQDFLPLAERLLAINTAGYESVKAKDLYDRLSQEIFPPLAKDLYETGRRTYNNGNYEEALEILKRSYELNPNDGDAIYFLARAYHRLQDYENAALYYTIITTDYQESRRYNDSVQYLAEISE